jgi:hypothetical protein
LQAQRSNPQSQRSPSLRAQRSNPQSQRQDCRMLKHTVNKVSSASASGILNSQFVCKKIYLPLYR